MRRVFLPQGVAVLFWMFCGVLTAAAVGALAAIFEKGSLCAQSVSPK